MRSKDLRLKQLKSKPDVIIFDDIDDQDITVSPEIVAKRLKWVQASIPYEDAKRIAQKECNEAYNKVIPYNDPMWDTLETIAPHPFK